MTDKIKNDPFEPWNQEAHVRELEADDVFNRLVSEAIPGGLRSKLNALANSDNKEVQEVLAEHGVENSRVPRTFYLSSGAPGTVVSFDTGWAATIEVKGQKLTFNADNRDDAIMAAERYSNRDREPRELSETERYHISQLAQA